MKGEGVLSWKCKDEKRNIILHHYKKVELETEQDGKDIKTNHSIPFLEINQIEDKLNELLIK